ncbi:MAG TPA: hypothetical protein VKB77_05315 [Terriglobales bacterium]|nr:hypothetical protein [Terriglobales bacterium]
MPRPDCSEERRSRRIVARAKTLLPKEAGFCWFLRHGQPAQLALAEWLEELAVYGSALRPQGAETAYQLSQAIENWYLVRVALRAPGV